VLGVWDVGELLVEGPVGDREVAASKAAQECLQVRVAGPDDGAARAGLAADRLVERSQLGPDAAGAVIKHAGQLVAEAAAGA
jgi:hypothetical protein